MTSPSPSPSPGPVAVIGLGNMGISVLGALLARGIPSVAMDVDEHKVALTGQGRAVFPEEGIEQTLREALAGGLLTTTTDLEQAVRTAPLLFVAVPTPPAGDGTIDLGILRALMRDVEGILGRIEAFRSILLGSTVFPGTVRGEILPILGRRLRHGVDFQVAVTPVFLRAGTGMDDFLDPGRVVVGIEGARQEPVRALFEAIYPGRADVRFVGYAVCESIKAIHNAFMSLKVAFANEAARWCRKVGSDGREVMEVVLLDRQRLIAPSHMRPGPPFSGPCLPKDASAMAALVRRAGEPFPLLEAIHTSNEEYRRRLFAQVLDTSTDGRALGIIGVSFKPGFNEPRWGLTASLLEEASRAGFQVRAYDPAFAAMTAQDYRTACRGMSSLERWADTVRQPLSALWSASDRIFLNATITKGELETIRAAHQDDRPRLVLDLFGTAMNAALGQLAGVAYRGACW